ncbi:hypothetical protein FAM09_07810 [Niastella caeni]|uniref:Uncharacterized protein n=1 Tax=Niastella caeni TaxID=2569763 RepID=A0A4S8HVV4_9BACT|nr:hypothetical protein [Niastella caeni]THU39793.1 hypothetical protein FAM09_07810 [Niastella caeni]
MATNIKHTLFNLEVTPPPEVWPDIAARLNTEFDAEETPVAQKMFDLSVPPPAGAWQKIAAHLPQQESAKKEGKLISLSVRKTVAAAAMVLLTLGAWYFLDKTNNADEGSVAGKTTNTSTVHNSSPAQSRTPAADTEIDERPVESIDHKPLASLSTTDAGMINARFGTRNRTRRTAFYDYQPIATSYAGVDEDKAVEFTENNNPTVEAPLIRDANGQVILDKKLITSPDDCYITITSPNGQQTRISSKFLHIISTLNDDVEPQDYFDFMMQENSLWRIRFSEWKEKFMNQASLIPTATSFTDILELKDLLMEEDDQ